MKGVGMDATKLFDDVHAWVNYEQLLTKCYIGPLRTSVILNLGIDEPQGTAKKATASTKLSPTSSFGGFLAPQISKLTHAKSLTKIAQTQSPSDNELAKPIEIIPRFDWLQNINDLYIIFYTKSLCNSGIIVHYSSNSNCDIKIVILIEHVIHVCSFKFIHEVQWPGVAARVNTDTGKIEVIFKKMAPSIWANFGQYERKKSTDLCDCNYVYDICEREQITHDSYALIFKPRERLYQVFPIGYHVSITAIVGGKYPRHSWLLLRLGLYIFISKCAAEIKRNVFWRWAKKWKRDGITDSSEVVG